MNYRNYLVKISVYVFIFVLSFSIATSGLAAENLPRQDANAAYNFCVAETPGAGSFPDVDIVFRAFDQGLNPINNLAAKDIRISENGQSPVQLQDGMQINSLGLGIDFHIIVNKGNRTDQAIAKNILTSFLRYYDQGKDQVYIYTDDGNSLVRYFTPSLGIPLTQVITDYPTDRVSGFRVMDAAIRGVLSDIEADKAKCQKQKFIFLLLGDDTISENNFLEYSERVLLANTKIIVFHIPTENGGMRLEDSYRNFAEQSGGKYVSAANDDVSPFLSTLSSYRQSYEVQYRSVSGDSGQRTISFVYQGVNYAAQGDNIYTLNMLPPQVTVTIPSIVERTAIEVADIGYIYDIKDVEATLQVTFPDQFPRKVETLALIVNQAGRPELRIPVEIISSTGDTYKFKWTFGDIGDARQTDLSLKVEIVDELGNASVSPETPAIVISHIPLIKIVQRYYLYVALGIILVLLIALALMWRRIKNSAVGQRITSVVQNVRKTLVGAARGKPLASLRIIEGPQNMLNQELKIYTESVKLGRDPQKADMTFYGTDVNSSISGLHARIERVNQSWRLVALSTSRSETFVNDDPISFNDPYQLSSGQVVRLGYTAQQPVVFEFIELAQMSVRKTETNPRITDVRSDTMPIQPKQSNKKNQSLGQDDDIFNEYRDR